MTQSDKNTREFAVFHSIGKALTSSLNLQEVLGIILEQISEQFGPSHWSLLLYNEETKKLRFELVIGQQTEHLQGRQIDDDHGVAGWVARSGKGLIVPDVKNDARFDHSLDQESGFETTSIVAVPLISKNRVLGVIELINVLEDQDFGEHDFELLTTLGDYAAIAIENARSVERIRELTVTDDVTSLYNARYLQQSLEQEYRRSRRYNMPLSVIFIDLDYFKTVNDTHGHLVGSDVLREVALLLVDQLRATDIATRYGGDEFVLILPETSKSEALLVATRIREALKQTTFAEQHGLECSVQASFGVATLPDDTNNKTDLIRLADQAMYHVKENNRDAIATADVLEAT